jgi:hypothetical protein
VDFDALPDRWFCELNADGRYSSCDVVEQEWSDDDDEQIGAGAPPAAYFEPQSASPPQAGSRPAASPQSRVSPGGIARGGKACPSERPSPYDPAKVSPSRAPPAAWAALARRMPAVGEKRALDQTADSSDSAATGRNDIGASAVASPSGTAAASPPSPPAKKRHRTKVAAAGQPPTLTATDVMDHWLADARLPSDLRYVHDVNAIF